ncbi:MAG: hypothetical protein IJ572_01315 [Bacilli bacterium]|nr:hypothetical protein [Bacilli bacterium]
MDEEIEIIENIPKKKGNKTLIVILLIVIILLIAGFLVYKFVLSAPKSNNRTTNTNNQSETTNNETNNENTTDEETNSSNIKSEEEIKKEIINKMFIIISPNAKELSDEENIILDGINEEILKGNLTDEDKLYITLKYLEKAKSGPVTIPYEENNNEEYKKIFNGIPYTLEEMVNWDSSRQISISDIEETYTNIFGGSAIYKDINKVPSMNYDELNKVYYSYWGAGNVYYQCELNIVNYDVEINDDTAEANISLYYNLYNVNNDFNFKFIFENVDDNYILSSLILQ